MNAIKTVRIAAIQVESRNRDPEGNLSRAEVFVAEAANRGAQLILCPEFLAPGYCYDPSIWEMAELQGGPTEHWLAQMALQYRLFIGASYLEANGNDFFNTFALLKPDGTVAGRVRKESLPGFEGWFFSGCSGTKVIDTELGRLGIGICWDNNTSRFMRRINHEQVDLLLMPHSAPRISIGPWTLVGDSDQTRLRELAGFYAGALGIPTVMSNKAADEDSQSPMPCVPLVKLRFHFMGQSTICDADGNVCDQLAEQPGIVFAEVVLDAARRKEIARPLTGYWSRPPSLFPRTIAALFQTMEWMGKTAYQRSRSRRLAARAALARFPTEQKSPSSG